MFDPAVPSGGRPPAAWKVWCAVAAATVVLVGGSAVVIELAFNTTPDDPALAPE